MPSLLDAYKLTYPDMKPQVQGTCGIYSFWYATILLHHLNGAKYPVVPFPRACHGGDKGKSMRHYAKKSIGSAQGELLTTAEMVNLVEHFGYEATVYHWYTNPWGRRPGFITESLKANRPVLFAYLMGAPAPVTKATATVKDKPGPHWSLIIAETTTDYGYIEPNNPNEEKALHASHGQILSQLRWYPKNQVLESNASVDEVKLEQKWVRHAYAQPVDRTQKDLRRNSEKVKGATVKKTYDLGDRAAGQSLNDVLIAVG